jgi:parallel beta-helix repeat protein
VTCIVNCGSSGSPRVSLAKTYYIDASNGNDSYSGVSQDKPWRTISKSNRSHFRPGDVVLFKRGEMWRESLCISSSGDISYPITFGAYGTGDRPIINGADIISGWAPAGNNIWKALSEKEPKLVFLNGTRGNRVISIEAIKKDRDWFWLDKTLYIFSTSNPNSGSTLIETGIRRPVLISKSFIVFKDIECKYSSDGGIDIVSDTGYDLSNIIVDQVISHDNFAQGITVLNKNNFDTHPITNITVNNSIIYNNGQHGIGFARYVKYGRISNNSVFNNSLSNGWHGISLWGLSPVVAVSQVIITGNIVYETQDNGNEGHGIACDNFSSYIVVENNYSYDNRGSGFILNKAHNCIVRNNIAANNGRSDVFSGGFCEFNGHDNEITNNVLCNNRPYGIYLFHNELGTTNTNINIKNNIIAENNREVRVYDIGGGSIFSDYNCYYHPADEEYMLWLETGWENLNGWRNISDQDTNSIYANPKFKNTQNGDFSLDINSPCIGKGIVTQIQR